MPSNRIALSLIVLALGSGSLPAETKFRSHPPTRPLPAPSPRPLAAGPGYFVDAAQGNDSADGTQAKAWKTVGRAVQQLKPGDTLYLRGGTYYEHVTLSAAGSPEQPITIRAFPNELVILDGGLREFFEHPATAWEACPGGVAGEFRSVKAYPGLGGQPGDTNVLGRFGDSLLPLHGYRFLSDLRSANEYWNIANKTGEDEKGIYCGPGLFYDPASGRLHVRLAHTTLKGLGDDNYRGETDPRQLPLIVAGLQSGPALTIHNARHVRLQDLVLRGARTATLEIAASSHIVLDGLSIYAGATAVRVHDSDGLRVWNTACRGIAAPWTFRGHLKYRAIEARIFSASHWEPTGQDTRDLELAYSEFTDSVDGVFLGNVRHVRFHHNLLDNVSDDGIFLTAATAFDGTTPGGDVQVYQNLLSRCLTTFAFGVGHGRQKATAAGKQTGAGVSIYRNVFDFRRPVWYNIPESPGGPQELTFHGRFAGDHGGPAWEPMRIYHNTILADDERLAYDYGTHGLGGAMGGGTQRRVFNNIVVQLQPLPGSALPAPASDFQGDGNLLWSVQAGPAFSGELFAKFRASKAYAESKTRYAPGWTTNDRFADPRFVGLNADWNAPIDLRLKEDSPALNAGVAVPADWSDPLRPADAGKPDIGVLPLGGEAWRVGVGGRLTMFGAAAKNEPAPTFAPAPFLAPAREKSTRRPIAIVQGYPAFDSAYVEYAFHRQGVPIEVFDRSRGWLPVKDYGKYAAVVVVGSLARAKIEPNRYDDADLAGLKAYLEQGGTLLLMRSGMDALATPPARAWLAGLTGSPAKAPPSAMVLRQPDQPWIKHLNAKEEHPWLSSKVAMPLRVTQGDAIIGSADGSQAILYRLAVGKGQLIYVGWEINESIPHGRLPSTPERERVFEDQVRIVQGIVTSIH